MLVPAPTRRRALLPGCWSIGLLIGLTSSPTLAQDFLSPGAPANPEACAALNIDVERLACYDAAVGRHPEGPSVADAQALQARQLKDASAAQQRSRRADLPRRERLRQGLSDLFRAENGPPNPLDASIANAGKGGLLDSRWELARDSKLGIFNLRAYKPVYLLPAVWSSHPNEFPTSSNPVMPAQPLSLKDVETKFQISFKTKAVENLFGDNGDIWMGYTQVSHWQVYEGDNSRPFRESNYEPEVMLVFRNNYGLGEHWRGRMLGIGINHQSNGRADPLSRSWNRVVMNFGLDRENWALMVRPWWRISDGSEDENPNIEDYVGRGDVTLVHTRGGHEFALMARHSMRSGDRSHGAVRFDWGFPLTRTLRGHLQVFDGYGESLIDYDHRSTQIGLGISLLEWF
ncbi:phospholipase A [Lysobacter sp. A286]